MNHKGYRYIVGMDSDYIYTTVFSGTVNGINYALIRKDMHGTHYAGFYPNVAYSLRIDITNYMPAYESLWKAYFSEKHKYREKFFNNVCKDIASLRMEIRNVSPGLWDDESRSDWIDLTLYEAMSKKQHYKQISSGKDNNLCAYYDTDFLHNTVTQVMRNFQYELEQIYISLFESNTRGYL